MPDAWLIEERLGGTGRAARVVARRRIGTPERRRVAVCRPTGPAVVLGSTQSPDVVDADAAAVGGVAVVRRRSGGGAVLVTPEDPVWIDLWVPDG